MLDPLEGLTPDGLIRTGASVVRIPEHFRVVLETAVEGVRSIAPSAAVYVYGSVATGVARSPDSDVDLLAIGLVTDQSVELGQRLSAEFVNVCRGVEIATATAGDLDGDSDEAYGARVFLHHYCVHLGGPQLDRSTSGYRGDRRAARGFNGDIAQHLARWRHELDRAEPGALARRAARKTLLAVSGLVSVHDDIWTTDRELAARRWQQLHPELSDGLEELLEWSTGDRAPTMTRLAHRIDTSIDDIVEQFRAAIGLWPA